MKLEHIALYTRNLKRLKDFYIEYFGAKPNDMYHNKNTGLKTYFLTFDGGARLEIMSAPDIEKRTENKRAEGLIHLAFEAGSKEHVDSLTERLVKAGYTLKSAPRTTGDGYYESCILDPDGNEVEITG